MTDEVELDVTTVRGEWGADSLFTCTVDVEGDRQPGGLLSVTEQDLASTQYSVEGLLDENPDHLVIEADQPGAGVAYQSESSATARWICDDRFVMVVVDDLVEGRDGAQDVADYLVSMLPWACGGEPVPEEGVDA